MTLQEKLEFIESNKNYMFPHINLSMGLISAGTETSVIFESVVIVEKDNVKYFIPAIDKYRFNVVEINTILNRFIEKCVMVQENYIVTPGEDVDSVHRYYPGELKETITIGGRGHSKSKNLNN